MKSENYENDRLQLNLQLLLECQERIQGVYPVYLPHTVVYTEKFVEEAHESTLQGGMQLTMAKVREGHWVPCLRPLVKRIVKKCTVDVDYAGPIKYKASEKCEGKAYLILYACSLTRALHLDLARSLETSEFLLNLKGLIPRRGRPSTIYSDNGSTFIGAAAWIRQVQSDEKLNDFLARHQITWKFKLSQDPWWGGQFECMVGLV